MSSTFNFGLVLIPFDIEPTTVKFPQSLRVSSLFISQTLLIASASICFILLNCSNSRLISMSSSDKAYLSSFIFLIHPRIKFPTQIKSIKHKIAAKTINILLLRVIEDLNVSAFSLEQVRQFELLIKTGSSQSIVRFYTSSISYAINLSLFSSIFY